MATFVKKYAPIAAVQWTGDSSVFDPSDLGITKAQVANHVDMIRANKTVVLLVNDDVIELEVTDWLCKDLATGQYFKLSDAAISALYVAG